MQEDFGIAHGGHKMVFVSDTDGTLFQVMGANFNVKLFDMLVEQKQAGNQVFICSAADGYQTGFALRIQLKKRGLPEDFFNIDHEDMDPKSQPIIPKGSVATILNEMGISRVDYVFEDQAVDYLPEGSYAQKINPAAFIFEDKPKPSQP